MLDFICELERVVDTWPQDANWSLAQIADRTASSVPQVVDILSDTLGRELEVHECISLSDATGALNTLKERMQPQLAARRRRLDAQREKAIKAYDFTMEKVRVLQMGKNCRSAYKTLSYYVGRYENDLPQELLVSLCGDCLRLGIKGEANLQELSMWFRKAVDSCLASGSHESIEEALDFIDAYSDYFADESNLKGRRLVANALYRLRESVALLNLGPQYDALVRDLNINADGGFQS